MTGSKYNAHDSPFLELRTPFTDKEALKLLLLLPTVIPRLLIAGLALGFVASVNTIVAWNWPVDKPLTPQRRAWILWSKEFLVVVLWMMGFRVRVAGREHIARAEELGSIVVFNHSSYVDALILMWLLAPAGVAKSSVSNIPIIRNVVRAYQPIFFHEQRARPASNGGLSASSSTGSFSVAATANGTAPTAAAADADADTGKGRAKGEGEEDEKPQGKGKGTGKDTEAKRGGRQRVRVRHPVAYIVNGSVTEVLQQRVGEPSYGKPGGFPLVAVAPEGTCGDGRGLLEYRTGAFVAGRPVLPLCIKYKFDGHNPAWTQVYSVAWHFVRLMCQWRNELEITFLPPYVPSPEERADPRLYAANVRALMGAATGLPPQPHNHSHFLALKKLNVVVDWSGTFILAPPGVVEPDGTIDFSKHGVLA